jgi:hypothetical protein
VVQLGRIRFLVNSAPVKQLLLNEMLSRAIKCSLRLMLRRKMEETTLPSEEPYRRELIDYFNLVLGKRPESDHFWKVEIKVTCCSSKRQHSRGLCFSFEISRFSL